MLLNLLFLARRRVFCSRPFTTPRVGYNFKPNVASSGLVDRLLEDGAPILSCAGGLMIEQPFVKEHIESIDGTEDAVMGLSKHLAKNLLHKMKKALPDVS